MTDQRVDPTTKRTDTSDSDQHATVSVTATLTSPDADETAIATPATDTASASLSADGGVDQADRGEGPYRMSTERGEGSPESGIALSGALERTAEAAISPVSGVFCECGSLCVPLGGQLLMCTGCFRRQAIVDESRCDSLAACFDIPPAEGAVGEAARTATGQPVTIVDREQWVFTDRQDPEARDDNDRVRSTEDEGAFQTTTTCPQCEDEVIAREVQIQLRAADESATRIYTCTDCEHRWREDD